MCKQYDEGTIHSAGIEHNNILESNKKYRNRRTRAVPARFIVMTFYLASKYEWVIPRRKQSNGFYRRTILAGTADRTTIVSLPHDRTITAVNTNETSMV